MKFLLTFATSIILFLSINPGQVDAEEKNDSYVNEEATSSMAELNVRIRWFSVDRPMPSDWNPPRTTYAEESFGGVRYTGTLSYAGTANRDGQIVAVYTGNLYEDTGYTPLSFK